MMHGYDLNSRIGKIIHSVDDYLLIYKSSAVAEMHDRLTTIADMGRKVEGCRAPLREELGLHLTQCGLRTKWYLDPSSRFATIGMGRKVGAAVPPFWGERRPRLRRHIHVD